MNFIRLLAVLLLLSFLSSASAESEKKAEAVVSVGEADFGMTFSYSSPTASATLRNASSKSVKIARIAPRLSEDKVLKFTPSRLAPGAEVSVSVQVQIGPQIGRVARYFDVYGESEEVPIGSFAIRGFVDWLVDPESVLVNFGRIDVTVPNKRTIDIQTRSGVELKLIKVVGDDPRFKVNVSDDGRSLTLETKPSAPFGIFDTYVVVDTDNAQQKRVGVHLRGQTTGRVASAENPVDFGLLRQGESVERLVRLDHLGGEKIVVGKIRSEGAPVSAELVDCFPPADSCKLLKIAMPKQTAKGQHGGVVFLDLPGDEREYPIAYGAIVIGEKTEIRSLYEDQQLLANQPENLSASLKAAVRSPREPMAMTVPAGTQPLLTWHSASEYGVFGYEIYRSTSEAGTYSKVSEKIVLRLSEDAAVGSVYKWRDISAKSGETYWYRIDVVYEDGRKARFSTAQKVAAK